MTKDDKEKKKDTKPYVFGFLLLLTFLIGYQTAINEASIKYNVYKFTNGEIDLVKRIMGSPKDRVAEDQILVTRDKIEIDIQNAEWSSYEPTGSMEPILSDTANGLYVEPKGPKDIQVGDIIAYSFNESPKPIVHRVTEIQEDEYGNVQYIVQGDANSEPDPEPVSFKDVKRVLIGVIY